MMNEKTRLGTALRFLSYILYEAGEALQRLGDILGDAGEVYDLEAPPHIARAKANARKAMDWLVIHAGAAAVLVSCCLAAVIHGLCLLGTTIKREAPGMLRRCAARAAKMARAGKEQAQKMRRACKRCVACGKRIGGAAHRACALAAAPFKSIQQDAARAWAFRAEIKAEARGMA